MNWKIDMKKLFMWEYKVVKFVLNLEKILEDMEDIFKRVNIYFEINFKYRNLEG